MTISFVATEAKQFAEFVLNKIISKFGWHSLEKYLVAGVNVEYEKSLKYDIPNFKLTNLFYVSTKPATKEELSKSGVARYSLKPIYQSDDLFCYLSNQWGVDSNKLNLDLLQLQKFVNTEYASIFHIDIVKSPKAYTFLETQDIFSDFGSNDKKLRKASHLTPATNTLYFGCPGTGKSHQLAQITEGYGQVFTTTFHPEYDYAAFVGSYKPKMSGTDIVYAFTPQVFTQAYVYACQHPTENVALVIEEINRGNCALIFGDIFQLLDRQSDGTSTYSITPDADLATHLANTLGTAFNGALRLPNNLSLFATMNTSDQSLFPMDSAFKRRWEWVYIPIDLSLASGMTYEVNGKTYDWGRFLSVINAKIWDLTASEDKQLGTFFVSGASKISEAQFKNKVMFYLWFDVFKNEIDADGNIFRDKEGNKFAFTDLFKPEKPTLLDSFLASLTLTPIETT